ncbi:MAG: cache domain-containing protein [Syntrophales bacterium]|nr:cache domain-containing protein [Syntrophales bacterium]
MIKNLNIWQKFFLGFLIIAGILLLITGQAAVRIFRTGVEQQAELTINKDLNSASRQLLRGLDKISLILKFISNDRSFKEAMTNNDLLYLQRLLLEYKEQNELSFAIITDPSGKIITSANNDLSFGERISRDDSFLMFFEGKQQKGIIILDENFLIRENLEEQAYIEIVPTPEARSSNKTDETKGLALTASIPIYNEEGEVIAILLGGELLNRDFDFVDEITEVFNVTATIFLDDVRIATSIRLTNDEKRAIGTRVSEEVASIVLDQGERYLGRAFILDQWYLTAYDPIFNNREEVIGILYVGIPEAPFVQMRKDTINNFALATGFSIFLAIGLAYFITFSITNPLNKLITTMQKVELGDLSQRYLKKEALVSDGSNSFVPLAGSKALDKDRNEIQQLGRFFNKMMESLQTNWKKNKELQLKLEEKEKMRLQLLEKLIVTQEEERKRISRELHDETSQSLTSLLLGLKLIQGADDIREVRKLAGNFREVIFKTLEEIQWLSYELRPSVLDDLGLNAALNRYVKELSQHANINIKYDLQEYRDVRLGSVVETTVYRVVQEALTNVIRHAGAQNIEVSLKSNDNNMEAIVEDDGKGFNLSLLQNDKQALGLFGMTERATLVGGELIIDTAPGKGTKIVLKIPLDVFGKLEI